MWYNMLRVNAVENFSLLANPGKLIQILFEILKLFDHKQNRFLEKSSIFWRIYRFDFTQETISDMTSPTEFTLNISKYSKSSPFTPSGWHESHVVMVFPLRISTKSFGHVSPVWLQPPEHTGLLILTLLLVTTFLGRAKFHLAPTMEHME